MPKVIIESSELNVRAGVSQRTGKPYELREQEALLRAERLAGPIRITLASNQPPYEPGEYEIDWERSLSFGRFNALEFRPFLKAIQTQTKPSLFPQAKAANI